MEHAHYVQSTLLIVINARIKHSASIVSLDLIKVLMADAFAILILQRLTW